MSRIQRCQRYFLILFSVAVLFVGCKSVDKASQSDKLYIVTTTGMIADGIRNICGDAAEVVPLMGSGIDPHYYKATQSDLEKLRKADIIFYNGLLLEGKMTAIFEKLAKTKAVFAVSNNLSKDQIRQDPQNPGVSDPHIWFDVSLWSSCMSYAANLLVEKDPANEAIYKANAEQYLGDLKELHVRTKNKISEIPDSQRVLITTHDAFGYFGRAYDMEVHGLQGISTVSDIGLADIKEMTEMIISRNIKAVFVESSVSDRDINAVISGCKEKGHQLKLGGVLYADAMGEDGTVEGTYIGMVNSNVDKIVNALK
ncbi:MAG: zinc ABC transporter solute-binding protein [Chitinophagales bacterium]|nr:zinc ABC transporter solute-binding protein [Chitinophagales bacterium]